MKSDVKFLRMKAEAQSPVLSPAVQPHIHERHTHARLDRLGIWLSTACAIHCLLTPILLTLLPVVSWIRWSRQADLIVLGVAAVIGLGGCLLSLRQHRDARPLCLVVAGLGLNAVGRFAGLQLGPVIAQTLIVAGPGVMAYGMWKDRQLCACNCGKK